jgi:3-oxoacyl-[acyl-carrier-protein] synthase-3
MSFFTQILGTGRAVPERVLTNADLERMVETSDEWITERTGIKERRIGDENTTASSLGTEAALKAMEMAGVTADDLDLILVATVTADMPFPSASCLIQKNLKAWKAAAMDLSAGCTGFIYGLSVADGYIKSGQAKTILLVGVEILTKITDWTDRTTCVLFGDGAGAVVLQASSNGSPGLLGTYLGADGRYGELLYMPGGGSQIPATPESLEKRQHYLKMEGNAVFKLAVQIMEDSCQKILQKVQMKPEQIDLLIPHQANLRIIQATAKRLKLPMSKVYVNIDRYGNTSSASIPIGLDEVRRSDLYKPGMNVLLVAFGAGLTWGSAVVTI